jgi:hypothetical protein
MKWKDKKDVCLISTTDDDKMVQTGVRGQDTREAQSSR